MSQSLRSFLRSAGAGLAACAGLLAAPAFVSAQANTDGIAAIVNEDVITFSDVKRQVRDKEKQLASVYSGSELYEKVKALRMAELNRLIERRLIIQEATAKLIQFPEFIVDDRIKDLVAQSGQPRAHFMRELRANGVSMDQLRTLQKESAMVGFMTERFVGSQITISPQRVEEFYVENAQEFATPEQVHLRMIFVKSSLFLDEEAEAGADPQRQKAQEILARLEAGADFAVLAEQFSDGSNAESGGDWGWVSRDTLKEDLSDTAFSLMPGEHSGILETEEGFWIVQVIDRNPSSVKSLTDVRETIEKKLAATEQGDRYKEWIAQLRSKAFVKIF